MSRGDFLRGGVREGGGQAMFVTTGTDWAGWD